MTRSKFSIKAALLAGGIGLSMAGFAGSQPAAAQSYSDEYSCPAGSVYNLTYGCTLPGATYDTYGTWHLWLLRPLWQLWFLLWRTP